MTPPPSAIWKSKSFKTGRPGALLEVDIDKLYTTPARENDFYQKMGPCCRFGALLGVKLPKICTTLAYANDLEIKIVKSPGAWDKHFCKTFFKTEALKLKNKAFLRDFFQKLSFEIQKRSISARLPSKIKLWNSKTKHFCDFGALKFICKGSLAQKFALQITSRPKSFKARVN